MLKTGKHQVRKLMRLSGSMVVSLPMEDVEKFGWRAGQKVVVKRQGRHLVVKDWKK